LGLTLLCVSELLPIDQARARLDTAPTAPCRSSASTAAPCLRHRPREASGPVLLACVKVSSGDVVAVEVLAVD
jgi:hypothetical protein